MGNSVKYTNVRSYTNVGKMYENASFEFAALVKCPLPNIPFKIHNRANNK